MPPTHCARLCNTCPDAGLHAVEVLSTMNRRGHGSIPANGDNALSFPSGEELLAAIRGHHVGPHPLTRLASELGYLHRSHRGQQHAPTCWRRTAVTAAIDLWVTAHLPTPRPRAALHTETLGTTVDRLAAAQVHAYHLLMTLPPADPQVHAAWSRLAELVNAYADLTTEVLRGQRRLPTMREHW